MRKLLVILGIVALALPAFAQFVPMSLENGLTAGLFENEIDQGFQVNPDFGAYAKDFLFAGLGNPYAGIPPLFDEMRAIDFALAYPLMFGYYTPKLLPVPFSVFGAADFTELGPRGIPSNYTDLTYANKAVISGTTTTNMEWVTNQTQYTYTDVVLTNNVIAGFQALTKIGPATFGLFFFMNKDNSDSDVANAEDNFVESVFTEYVDTAAVGVAPVQAADYTQTETNKNMNALLIPGPGGAGIYIFDTTMQFGIPVAIKTGTLDHRASLVVGLVSSDSSANYSNSESAHAQSVGGAANTEETLAIVAKDGTTAIGLNYDLRMPAGGTAGNEWRAGVSAGVDLNGAEYSYDYVARDYDLSVLNTKTPLAGGTHDSFVYTYNTTLDFNVDLSGARVFDFAFGTDVNYRFAPTVTLGLSTESNGGNALLAQTIGYTQVLNAAGAYNGAAYNRTTNAVTGNPASEFRLDCGLSLPMALKIKPAGWMFSLLFGATPAISVAMITNTTDGTTSTTTVENLTGATVNFTNITPTTNTASSSTTYDYNLGEVHYIGISANFSGVRLDARLNGTLLTFEGFTIQAVIPFN